RTSNHEGSRGEGIVLAARAGALVADLEFVQFHPTVLAGSGALISEAVRGAGAVLRDGSGSRFMVGRHPLAELAPRDVVSRECQRAMRERGEDEVWLDATGIERDGGAGSLARRFPGIDAAVRARGFDWAREPVPVSPAAHYTMGGVASDLDGRTTVPGLFVAGEIASTGVHGANRLASNSLLEGLVFGERAGIAAVAFAGSGSGIGPGAVGWELRGEGMRALAASAEPSAVGDREQREPADGALEASALDGLPAPHPGGELEAGAVLVEMIRTAAAARTESRGAHQRPDHREADPSQAHRRAFVFSFPSSHEAEDAAATLAPIVPALDPDFVPDTDPDEPIGLTEPTESTESTAPVALQRSLAPC
ncbi:MAG: FAD-binding protein, partial [Leucobacter sp.]